ncbi:hypothetical protein J6590_076806 [Homalodisca vitripennis]|nr:hypothetical protein J6590_076806 [Homalodisca vitripennis]
MVFSKINISIKVVGLESERVPHSGPARLVRGKNRGGRVISEGCCFGAVTGESAGKAEKQHNARRDQSLVVMIRVLFPLNIIILCDFHTNRVIKEPFREQDCVRFLNR